MQKEKVVIYEFSESLLMNKIFQYVLELILLQEMSRMFKSSSKKI